MNVITLVSGWMLALALGVAQAGAQPEERFDMLVRGDFLAGFAGDAERLARGMAACEQVLSTTPDHPQALVWHGSGLAFRAGTAMSRGDQVHGTALWKQGLAEMDRAITLAPDNPGVLIPRGALLLQSTRGLPPAMATPLLRSATANYQHALDVQEQSGRWRTLGDHAKGELLFGLAEGYSRLGEPALARRVFDRLLEDARTWPVIIVEPRNALKAPKN